MAETSNFPRLRLLPITIFAAALMLTVRVGDILDGVDGLGSAPIAVTGAEAQEQQGQPPAEADTAADAGAETPAEDEADMAASEDEANAQAAEAQAAAADEAAQEIRRRRPSLADDPTLFTQAEIDLLQQLAERRDQLDNREMELDQREAMMKAAETKIGTKVDQLQTLKATIEDLIKKYDQQQDEKLISLVKIYENMKPKDASKIFEQLEMDTLLLVAERMKERKLAAIMAKMTPGKAREMTEELYRLRQLPRTGDQLGG
ncbi:MotE family protein [Magnetospira sp. QH-2]|uniref:MotE family protein n=1 Tax=Magnetospira sp. (strain QH-2) TaxID=1288970 RepID=UPI0003E81372|nr:hypothetical protein [Magnetospira sp. QH-2]CCQ74120.1 Conserved protein of unknown function [Magnetospira sp. QH-2]